MAVKLLPPASARDRSVVQRFVTERSGVLDIDDPHLVRVLDLVVEAQTLAIELELVDGPDLRRYPAQRGTVAPAEAVTIARQVAGGWPSCTSTASCIAM